jgi:molecular chaperone Hsp33
MKLLCENKAPYSLCIFSLGAYLAESEQRSCALAAATSIKGILCTASGGYLIEQLPGAEQESIDKVSKNLAKLVEMDGGNKLPTNLLLSGVTPLEIASIILDDLDMQPLQQIEPKFVCKCSKDRLVRALRLLSSEEVADILEKEEKIEALCEFCGKVYNMSSEEAKKEMAIATDDPAKDDESNDEEK